MTKLTIPTADTFEYTTTSGNTLTLDIFRMDSIPDMINVTNYIVEFVLRYNEDHILVDVYTDLCWLVSTTFDYTELDQDTHLTNIISTIHKQFSESKPTIDKTLMFLDQGKIV